MVNENKLVIYNGMGKEETVKNLTTAQKKDITDAKTLLDNKVTAKKNDAKSGNKKLLDLGLTQAEATALTGYEPPEEE
tara:strand:- start:1025 stop:1258 length:234 start_codon:yes stop_codon:yes gene_type:complete